MEETQMLLKAPYNFSVSLTSLIVPFTSLQYHRGKYAQVEAIGLVIYFSLIFFFICRKSLHILTAINQALTRISHLATEGCGALTVVR